MPVFLKIKSPLDPNAVGRSTDLVNAEFSQKIKPSGDPSLPVSTPGSGTEIKFKKPLLRNPAQATGPTNIVLDAGEDSESLDGVVNALKTRGVELRLGVAGGGGATPMICGIMQHWPFRSLGITPWPAVDFVGGNTDRIIDSYVPMYDVPSGLNVWGDPQVGSLIEPYPPWVPGIADMRFTAPENAEIITPGGNFDFCVSFRSQPNQFGDETFESVPESFLRYWTDGNPSPTAYEEFDFGHAVAGGQFAYTGSYRYKHLLISGPEYGHLTLAANIDTVRRMSHERASNDTLISGLSTLFRTTPEAATNTDLDFLASGPPSAWRDVVRNNEQIPTGYASGESAVDRTPFFIYEASIANSSDFCFIFRMFEYIPAGRIQWQLRIYPCIDRLANPRPVNDEEHRGFFSCYSSPPLNFYNAFEDRLVYFADRVLVRDMDKNKEWQPGEKLVQFVAEDTQLDMASFSSSSESGVLPRPLDPESYTANIETRTLHFPLFAFLGHEQLCIMIPYASETLGLRCGFTGVKQDSPFFAWKSAAEYTAGKDTAVSWGPGKLYACGAPLLPRAVFEVRARYELDGVQQEQVFRLDHRYAYVLTDGD